ncbi:serine/threonine protein kinase [Ornithinibacillus halotolerans]|uniref:Serine/threonine protein kinase n=1 Tax=Ornithinibacillus halotolerans TaxID=1274357 RepID=A0A916RL30_9BACI|nr:serine/threonine protein kinase [Ornithinibacillus halotolerans]GGA60731.1 serine/threonine protein kinase [Ornithinibacillus halotolerans]
MRKLQTITLDNVSFQLQEKYNFDWLTTMGNVFKVFDEQDSGNISFGIEKDGMKKFIKFAGAKTKEYNGKPEDAINTLKKSVHIYNDLQHKQLIRLLDNFEVENGYALVFEWFEGECLHSHWAFPPPLKYTHPDSPYFKFKNLPTHTRLKAFQSILEFHVHVERNHYVAVDFYDGSVLYDFNQHEIKICDIDLYKKKPFTNQMGRLWGSSRFMSPEEFELGAEIDSRTNVFNMGAIAFALLGGETDRSITKWDAGKELYEIATKAVSQDRSVRYATVEEFYNVWSGVASNLNSTISGN